MNILIRATLGGLAAAVLSSSALAQCEGVIPSPIGQPGFDNRVLDLRWYDPDGGGPIAGSLIATGDMTLSGTTPVSYIARFDGAAWVGLGAGIDQAGQVLGVTGQNELAVSGFFSNAGGAPASRVARWNGTTWSTMGTGFNSLAFAFATRPNGDLHAGGWFQQAGFAFSRAAKWNGTQWSPVGTGNGPNDWIWDIVTMPNGDLIYGGAFTTIGGQPFKRIARWNGTAWSTLGTGVDTGNEIYELLALPNGHVIASGNFSVIGGVSARNIARFDGTSWHAMGAGTRAPIRDMLRLSNGDILVSDYKSEDLTQTYIAKWDGSQWITVVEANSTIFALAELPNGDIAVGGSFTAIGGQNASRVAVWRPGIPLAITSQPSDAAICAAAGPVSFSVAATGGGTITYQWMRDTVAIDPVLNPSAATTQLTIASPSVTDNGVYTVAVSDGCTTLTSSGANFIVTPADTGSAGGQPGGDGQYDNNDFIAFINLFFAQDPRADIGRAGGQFGSDGVFDNNDFIAFINQFFSGC